MRYEKRVANLLFFAKIGKNSVFINFVPMNYTLHTFNPILTGACQDLHPKFFKVVKNQMFRPYLILKRKIELRFMFSCFLL